MSSEKVYIGPGTLLIAEPFLQEPLFGRSVILICHHDDQGSFGLILNKPAANPFSEEDQDHPLVHFPFFAGGPVESNSMFYIHSLPDIPEAVPVKDGIFWQGDYHALLGAIEDEQFRPDTGKLLVGYAGWSEGQLQEELEREDWMVYNGSISGIFEIEADQMWKRLLENMGPYYKMISNFPIDPSLN